MNKIGWHKISVARWNNFLFKLDWRRCYTSMNDLASTKEYGSSGSDLSLMSTEK